MDLINAGDTIEVFNMDQTLLGTGTYESTSLDLINCVTEYKCTDQVIAVEGVHLIRVNGGLLLKVSEPKTWSTMTDDKFEQVANAVLTAASGDPLIMTGLPSVDLRDENLKFIRILEICEKVEALRSVDNSDHYNWFENLGLEDVKGELIRYWAVYRTRTE